MTYRILAGLAALVAAAGGLQVAFLFVSTPGEGAAAIVPLVAWTSAVVLVTAFALAAAVVAPRRARPALAFVAIVAGVLGIVAVSFLFVTLAAAVGYLLASGPEEGDAPGGAVVTGLRRGCTVAAGAVGLVTTAVYVAAIVGQGEPRVGLVVGWAVAMAAPSVAALVAAFATGVAVRGLLVAATATFLVLGVLAVFSVGYGLLVAALLGGAALVLLDWETATPDAEAQASSSR